MNAISMAKRNGTKPFVSTRISMLLHVVCRAIIALTFGISGIQKVADAESFQQIVQAYGFPPSLSAVLIVAVPFVEIAISILVLFGITMRFATIVVGAVTATYTAVILISLITGNVNHGCGCFIGASNPHSAAGVLFGGNHITWIDFLRDIILLIFILGIWLTNSPMFGLDRFWTNTREYWRFYRGKGYLIGVLIMTGVISSGLGGLAAANLAWAKNAPISVGADFEPSSDIRVGQTAPAFTLRSMNGNSVSLSHYRGKVVLLEFFAVWCSNCQQEAPLINHLQRNFPANKFQILSIIASPYGRNYESSNEQDTTLASKADVTWYEQKYHVTSPILVDPHFSVTNEYIAKEYPNIIVIDPRGRISSIHIGPTPYATLSQDIKTAIND